jgi:UDP-2,3-diacylglucosamine hydrolase
MNLSSSSSLSSRALPHRLAVIAGGGIFPLRVLQAAEAQGIEVLFIGLQGCVDANVYQQICACTNPLPPLQLGMGQMGAFLKVLQTHQIQDIVFIGHLVRPNLLALKPDFGLVKMLPRLAQIFRGGDDTLLRGLMQVFEEQGLTIWGAHTIAPSLLMPQGALGHCTPDAATLEDIKLGFQVLETLSPFDIGQAVVVAHRQIWGVEAIEGTDGLLERIKNLRHIGRLKLPQGQGVLVKAPKKNQDARIDLPAIGCETVEKIHAAGLAGLAVKAGQVLCTDPTQMAQVANDHKLFVYGATDV